MGVASRLRQLIDPLGPQAERGYPLMPLTGQDWTHFFQGVQYAITGTQTLPGAKQEISDGSFRSLVDWGLKKNGIVFGAELARLMIFSEARFQFRRMSNGRPGDLFGTDALTILEKPWPGGTTGDLLMRMLQAADLNGTAVVARRRDRLKVLMPDWTVIVTGSPNDPSVTGDDIDAELVGCLYFQGGIRSGTKPVVLTPREFALFAPIPDPVRNHCGIPWPLAFLREIAGDSAATDHILHFFENGATPNMVVTLDKDAKEAASTQSFKEWVRAFKDEEPTGWDAFKTLYLTKASVNVIGRDMQQAALREIRGGSETRIALGSGIHPVILGLSEGLQGSSLNVGNFGAARRVTADKTMRPLWRNAAGSLAAIVDVPAGADLWYDDRDIAFLREDRKDAAEIQQIKAASIRQLVDAGYEPATVVAAVESEDMGLLNHTGLFSVQLQPPMSSQAPPPVTAQQAGLLLAELIARRIERPALPAPETELS